MIIINREVDMLKFQRNFNAIPVLVALQSSPALANDVPHIVPALNCPQGQVCCPSEIYCSYSEGCGDTGFWYADGQAISSFGGVKQFKLTNIQASISDPKAKTYWYYCNYTNIESEGYINLVDADYKLNGDWQYSGFGNENAKCKSNNPLDCTATKVSYTATQKEYTIKHH